MNTFSKIFNWRKVALRLSQNKIKLSHQVFGTSVMIGVVIIEISKGILEPVRALSVPFKVGRYMNQNGIW